MISSGQSMNGSANAQGNMSLNPFSSKDILRDILSKEQAPPVIVPRSNQNVYQVLSGTTGIDRAINYINYDQSQ